MDLIRGMLRKGGQTITPIVGHEQFQGWNFLTIRMRKTT